MTLLPIVPVFDGWVMTAEWLARLTQQLVGGCASGPLGSMFVASSTCSSELEFTLLPVHTCSHVSSMKMVHMYDHAIITLQCG